MATRRFRAGWPPIAKLVLRTPRKLFISAFCTLFWAASFVFLLAVFPTSSFAQDESSGSLQDPFPNIFKDGSLQTETRLWLRGADGTPVPTNITLEQLREMERQASLASQLPDATFERMDVDVVVSSERAADVTGRFAIRLGEQETPARVDLRFGTVQLTENAAFDSSKLRSRFGASPDGDGYRWWMLGEEDSVHSITLKGKTPIKQSVDRRSLRLVLPPSPASIKVLLPSNVIDERVSGENVLERTVTPGGIQLSIASAGGEVDLSWRNENASVRISALEASSRTLFDVTDPRQVWSATTNLSVRWYGSDASPSFRVLLPPGAAWRTFPNVEFDRFRISLESLTAEDFPVQNNREPERDATGNLQVRLQDGLSEPSVETQQLVIENLDPTQSKSLDIVLEWEWLPATEGQPGDATGVQLPVPQILDVDSHVGTIDCIFPSSYSTVFQERSGAKLIQQGRAANMFGRQQMQFRFQQQAFELLLTFRREQSLPTVRPTYVVSVDQNKLVLTAWFDCSFDTNRQDMEIGIIPGDWIVEENTACVVSDPNAPYSSNTEVLTVRPQDDGSFTLSGREPDSGFGNGRRVEQLWRIVAERSWTPDDGNALEFKVPEIIRGRNNGVTEIDHGSGVLLVDSDRSVLMQWDETASTGLLADSFSTEYKKFIAKVGIRDPLAYRFQSRGTTPSWAGRASFLPQQISFEQHSNVEVLEEEIVVRQDFDVRIAYQPLTDIVLAVRSGSEKEPEVFVDGNLTAVEPFDDLQESDLTQLLSNSKNGADPLDQNIALESRSTAGGDSARASSGTGSSGEIWKLYRVVGSNGLIGSANVTVITSVPWAVPSREEDASNESTAEISVPLVQAVFQGHSGSIRADWALTTALQIDASVADTSVGRVELQPSSEKRRTLKENQLALELKLRRRAMPVDAAVLVEGSWLQTAVNGNERRDRFVARVRSSSGTITVRLPVLAQIERVAVDGVQRAQTEAPYDYNSNSVTITLTPESSNQTHIVELFYYLPETLSWATRTEIAPPVIQDAEIHERFYWQLVTPSVQHLALCPSGLTAEWTWQWGGFWWYRSSGEDQTSLERWLGASNQTRLPLSANSYVMSGQGEFAAQQVWIISRFVLWFPVGCTAISLAVLALNVPALRHPTAPIFMAGVIISVAMVWPDLSVLMGQTAVISLSLVVLILVTQSAIETRVRRRSVFTSRPSTFIEIQDQNSGGGSQRIAQSTARRSGSSIVSPEVK